MRLKLTLIQKRKCGVELNIFTWLCQYMCVVKHSNVKKLKAALFLH